MADTIRYVNTGSAAGGDGTTNDIAGDHRAYPSLSAWSADESGAIPSGDRHIVYCSGSVSDSLPTEINGWAPADAESLIIKQHTDDAHGGLLQPDTKYCLDCSGNSTSALYLNDNNIVVDGLQFIGNASTQTVRMGTFVSGCVVRNCIVNGGRSGIYASLGGGTATIYNNIVFDTTESGIVLGTSVASDCMFNTVSNCNTSNKSFDGGIECTATVNCSSNVAVGCGVADVYATAQAYNASSDTSAVGTGSITNIVAADEFVNPTTYNFNLQQLSVLVNAGATNYAEASPDCADNIRDVAPDIGALEYMGVLVGTPHTLTFTGLADNTEVRLYKVSDDSEIDGIEDSSGGTVVLDFEYFISDIEVYYHIHNLDYWFIRNQSYMLTNNDSVILIQQIKDRTYKNPA